MSSEDKQEVFEVTVDARGRVTLPKALRERLGFSGDGHMRLTFGQGDKTQVVRLRSLDELWALADSREEPQGTMSFEQMDEAKARRIW